MSCIISLNLIKNLSCLITYSTSRESRQRIETYRVLLIPEITVPAVVNATTYTAVYKVIYTFSAVLPHVTSVFKI